MRPLAPRRAEAARLRTAEQLDAKDGESHFWYREGVMAALRVDPRFEAFYSISLAAHCLQVRPSTLSFWAFGRVSPMTGIRYRPLFKVADHKRRLLSFVNLIEAQVLRGLRSNHELTLQNVRKALQNLEPFRPDEPHPLAFIDFLTDNAGLFVEHLGDLIDLTRPEQYAIKATLIDHLSRVERGSSEIKGPVRFFPLVPGALGERPVQVDPRFAFGRPVLTGTRIPTQEIAARVTAGEPPEEVAVDMGLKEEDVEKALAFEGAQAA